MCTAVQNGRPLTSAWKDFRRLWAAYSVSEAGSAIGAGALPLIAITTLGVAAWQVTLMATIGGVVAALLALPLGPFVERHTKRPFMIATDLVRFAILAAVPIAAALGQLNFVLLCVAQATLTAGAISFAAANASNLKSLLPPDKLLDANSRVETTYWTAAAAGPPIGGVLIGWFGATVTVAINSISFLLSAIGISRVETPEPEPPRRASGHNWLHEVREGWGAIVAAPTLRALFLNAMLFGSGLLLMTAVLPVFMLRDLGLTPWQYGLALGLPGLGGVLGAACSAPIARRIGERQVLLALGTSRTLWAGLVCLAPPGAMGLTVIIACDFLLMFSAGTFNPVFTTHRMRSTPDHVMARVSATWSVSAKCAQSAGMFAGGLVATGLGVRPALATGALLMLCASLALPWRRSASTSPHQGHVGRS